VPYQIKLAGAPIGYAINTALDGEGAVSLWRQGYSRTSVFQLRGHGVGQWRRRVPANPSLQRTRLRSPLNSISLDEYRVSTIEPPPFELPNNVPERRDCRQSSWPRRQRLAGRGRRHAPEVP
jgi:hypothetical protein